MRCVPRGRTAQISASSDSAFHREHSSQNRSLMSTPLIADSPRSQPTRLVFCGAFCLWAKLGSTDFSVGMFCWLAITRPSASRHHAPPRRRPPCGRRGVPQCCHRTREREKPRWCWGQALTGGRIAPQFHAPQVDFGLGCMLDPMLAFGCASGVEHDAGLQGNYPERASD